MTGNGGTLTPQEAPHTSCTPFATTRVASTTATTQPCAGARLVGTSTMTLGEHNPCVPAVKPQEGGVPRRGWLLVPSQGWWEAHLVGRSDRALPLLPSVSPVSENQVASSEGYVLFYQLTQEPPRGL